jgi:hypothetical protein
MKKSFIPRDGALNPPLRREIHPEVKIIDQAKGIVDYVASDETLDYYQEVIRVGGWKFTNFAKNSPFVDSHNYSTIANLLGRVLDFKVDAGKLVERVQWAVDVPDTFAAWGWKMVLGGFLKAVSVGFYPTTLATRWDSDKTIWLQQLKELGLREEDPVRAIYIEQEQLELSACIIGANPNALAKAYKGGCFTEQELDQFTMKIAQANTATAALSPAGAAAARRRAQLAILLAIQKGL